ncbi:MAG TPA: DoxX family protein [Candidatus Paceibacterota bacterium]|jgi:uncharacterized membrane protein YphA (DoxX/SURF4 family)|nr:DoxX family protein [Candidatus Paceibacterota bacterium]
MTNGTGTKIPHTLRFIIFLLRLALGINFFYLGWGALFDHGLGNELQARSFGDLYSWLTANVAANAGAPGSLQTFFAWAFLVIGICLILGLVMRLMALAGIVLTLASFLPTFSYSPLSAFEFANGEIVLMLCLLILIFANAGEYFGIDKFLHFHLLNNKHKDK